MFIKFINFNKNINLNKKFLIFSLTKNPSLTILVILYPPKPSENFLKWSDVLGTTRFDKDVGLMNCFLLEEKIRIKRLGNEY